MEVRSSSCVSGGRQSCAMCRMYCSISVLSHGTQTVMRRCLQIANVDVGDAFLPLDWKVTRGSSGVSGLAVGSEYACQI